MTPAKAAFQLIHLWRDTLCQGKVYPVKCDVIAEALGIKVHGDESLGDDFEAGLFIEPNLKAIVFNHSIRETGRKNFSVGHELGHFSLHKDIKEIRCSFSALADMAPHPRNIEQEANLFAAHLLMPADDFRTQIDGRPLTMGTIRDLAGRYDTSLTATCFRRLDVCPKFPLAMVRVRGKKVHSWAKTEEMRWTGFYVKRGQELPAEALMQDPDGSEVESERWLSEKNAPRWTLTQSSIYKPYYDETQILIRAERTAEHWDSQHEEEPDPTPPRIPSFR